jgi:hypothetical protein
MLKTSILPAFQSLVSADQQPYLWAFAGAATLLALLVWRLGASTRNGLKADFLFMCAYGPLLVLWCIHQACSLPFTEINLRHAGFTLSWAVLPLVLFDVIENIGELRLLKSSSPGWARTFARVGDWGKWIGPSLVLAYSLVCALFWLKR